MNDDEKRTRVLEFFKDAFVVDGDVRFATLDEAAALQPSGWIRLEDSKRGVFFIARGV